MKIQRKPPQFNLEKLYASPFTYERKYRPDGSIYWEKLTDPNPTTGIDALDDFLRYLRSGYRTVKSIASLIGVTPPELNAFVKILTGQNASEFIRLYLVHQAQLMLKYTDLTVDEIAQHCSFSSNSNLTQSFIPVVGVSPKIYRYQHQGPLDRGRFRIK